MCIYKELYLYDGGILKTFNEITFLKIKFAKNVSNHF